MAHHFTRRNQGPRRAVYIVTGASSGIGFATARMLIARGEKVLACIGPTSPEQRPEIGHLRDAPACEILELDFSEPACVFDLVVRKLSNQPVAGIVNAAGIAEFGALEQMRIEQFERTFRINALGPFLVTAAGLAGMRRRSGGVVINLSSGAAAAPLPFAGLYAGSKAYLEAASFALRRELIAFGIKVSVLRLGKVASTRFGRTTAAAQISEPYTRIHEHIERTLFDAIWPSGQAWPTAESIASTIVTILNLENPEALYELGEELARLYSTASVVPGKLD